MTTHRPQRPPARDDRGSAAIILMFAILLCGMFVTFLVDGDSQLRARTSADTYASEAARAAALAVGPAPVGNDTDTEAAADAARDYLASAGAHGTVTVTGPATVAVTVTVTGSTPILGMSIDQTRTHTAQLYVGVTTGSPLP